MIGRGGWGTVVVALGITSATAGFNLVVGSYTASTDEDGGGGSAPTCGSTSPPTTAAYQQLVKACVLAVSCDPGFFVVNASQCVTDDYLHAFGSLACLTTIASCSDYYSCTGGSIAMPSACSETSSLTDVGTCSGGVATSCYYNTQSANTIANCGATGGTCKVYSTDSSGDQAAGCSLGACTDTDSAFHCMGTSQIYQCMGGAAIGQTCPADSQCGTIAGSTSCYYQSPSCPTAGASCSGGTLSICSASPVSSGATNETVSYDCTTAGLACKTDDAGSGDCVSPGCEQSSCQEGCESTSGLLTLCVGGVADTFDCTANGFSSCATDTQGSTTYAYCTY